MKSDEIFSYVRMLEDENKRNKALYEEHISSEIKWFDKYKVLLDKATNSMRDNPRCPHNMKNIEYDTESCNNCLFSTRKKNQCWKKYYELYEVEE